MKKEGSEKERCFKTDLSQSKVGSEKTSSGELFLFVLSFFFSVGLPMNRTVGRPENLGGTRETISTLIGISYESKKNAHL